MSEGDLSRAIREALEQTGLAIVVRTQSGQTRGRSGSRVHHAPEGWPDLSGWRLSDGRAVFLEVKLPGQRLSLEQMTWRDRMLGTGALWGVVTSVAEAIEIVRGGR